MTTTTDIEQATAATVRVVNFAKGVKYARTLGGKFDPEAKVWSIAIPAGESTPRCYLRAAGAYGLSIVKLEVA